MQNPAEQLKTVPLTILVPDLLKQFNKATLLGQRGVRLTKIELDAIGNALAEGQVLPDNISAINTALSDIIQESVDLLAEKFSLSVEQSLQTSTISDVADWETTADFLEIANEKSNAELRISAGISLMVFLGDVSLADYLLTVIRVDAGANDVDAMIAKRALSHYAKIEIDADDWLETVRSIVKRK
ncbi:MAG: hypothetical protein Phog2KO_24820 [Phototrophicaceae bacterium]